MYGILAAAENDDFIYFSHMKKNGLYKIDKNTNEVFYIACFDWESFEMEKLHRRAVYSGNYIIFFPRNARKVAIYDIRENKLKPCNFEISGRKIGAFRCQSLSAFDDTVLVLGNDGEDKIMKVHLDRKSTNNITDYEDLSKIFAREKLILNDNMGLKSASKENQLYYVSGADNKVLSYDMKSGNYSIYTTDNVVLSALIKLFDNKIWFVFRGISGFGYIDILSGEKVMFNDYPSDFICKSTAQPFISMHFIDEYIIFVPARANAVIYFDTKTGTFQSVAKVTDIIKDFDEQNETFPFSYVYETDIHIVALFNGRDGALVIRKSDLRMDFIYILPGIERAYTDNLSDKVKKLQIIKESNEDSIVDFLRML